MECFNKQVKIYKKVTNDIYDKIVFKRVWSGEMIQVGDKVLYAYAFDPHDDDIKMLCVLERELANINSTFDFVGYKDNIIPVLKFKTDAKKREYTDKKN